MWGHDRILERLRWMPVVALDHHRAALRVVCLDQAAVITPLAVGDLLAVHSDGFAILPLEPFADIRTFPALRHFVPGQVRMSLAPRVGSRGPLVRGGCRRDFRAGWIWLRVIVGIFDPGMEIVFEFRKMKRGGVRLTRGRNQVDDLSPYLVKG